jgi:hypothetical protein
MYVCPSISVLPSQDLKVESYHIDIQMQRNVHNPTLRSGPQKMSDHRGCMSEQPNPILSVVRLLKVAEYLWLDIGTQTI